MKMKKIISFVVCLLFISQVGFVKEKDKQANPVLLAKMTNQEYEKHIQDKTKSQEEHMKKDREWKDNVKKRYEDSPKLHAVLIKLLDSYKKKDLETIKSIADKFNIVLSSDRIKLILKPRSIFNDDDIKEIEKRDTSILDNEKSKLGLVAETSLKNIKHLCEIADVEFIRPMVIRNANFCNLIANNLKEKVEITNRQGKKIEKIAKKTETWHSPKSNKDIEIFSGQLSIRFNNTINNDEQTVEELVKTYNCCATRVYNLTSGKRFQITFPTDLYSIDEILDIFGHEPTIEDMDVSGVGKIFVNSPDDPYFTASQQWGLQNIGQTIGGQTGIADKDIDAPEAWDYTTGSNNITVAVIDTGIDLNHEDLINKFWINTKETANNGVDDDGNGFIDDYNGVNFISTMTQPMDDYSFDGHGTLVAGIIGAQTNNNVGMAGVNWNAKIMILKAVDETGQADPDAVASAIKYAANPDDNPDTKDGAQIINLSLGWYNQYYSQVQTEINIVVNYGITIVVAAGNDYTSNLPYPAWTDKVITVGATDNRDSLYYVDSNHGSNYGSELDLVAPGVNILTTIVGGYSILYSGTSLSAPFVSGAAALILSRYSALNLTPSQVRQHLMATADDIGLPGFDIYTGAGRLNIYKAVHDTLNPPAPTVASPTHPYDYESYSERNPKFTWQPPFDVSGIAGYSYSFNQDSADNPNDTIDATPNNLVTCHATSLGTWYFHIRAKDNANHWSATTHFKITNISLQIISGPNISYTQEGNVIIKWNTNTPCNTEVRYWLESSSIQTSSKAEYTKTHEVILSGLQEGEEYYFSAISGTSSDSVSSGDNTFRSSNIEYGYVVGGYEGEGTHGGWKFNNPGHGMDTGTYHAYRREMRAEIVFDRTYFGQPNIDLVSNGWSDSEPNDCTSWYDPNIEWKKIPGDDNKYCGCVVKTFTYYFEYKLGGGGIYFKNQWVPVALC